MIKFSEILVSKPEGKKEILEYIINNNLESICAYDTWEGYQHETGTELEDEELKYAKAYFKAFKPGDVYFMYMGENETGNIDLPKPHKCCWYSSDDETGKLIFHNIIGLEV